MIAVACDTETYRIGSDPAAKAAEGIGVLAVAPAVVCLQTYCEADADAHIHVGHDICRRMLELLRDENVLTVWINGAFDLAVLASNYGEEMLHAIFDALYAGRVTCASVREKLVQLATTGDLDYYQLPDGSYSKMSFSMAGMAKRRLGIDLSESKKLDEDAWRGNYHKLDHTPVDQWPESAQRYARDDALYTYRIYEKQEAVAKTVPAVENQLKLGPLRTLLDFCLMLVTCHGLAVDRDLARQKLKEALEELEEVSAPLILAGVVIPAEPERPYKNGAIDKATGLPKMAKAQPESLSMKAVQARVEATAQKLGEDVPLTAKGRVATNNKTLKAYATFDPILTAVVERRHIQKLTSTYLPMLCTSPTVHPKFNCLVASGRMSSYGSDLFPSTNIQNVDPRARPCYVARPGKVLCSLDYPGIELVSIGYFTKKWFGHSVHYDLIQDGCDLHATFGTKLYNEFERPSVAVNYTMFKAWEHGSDQEKQLYKWWRKLGKVFGLALPGGMGPKTMISYCMSWGINLIDIAGGVDEAIVMCKRIKQAWLDLYVEMHNYFEMVNYDQRFQDTENTIRVSTAPAPDEDDEDAASTSTFNSSSRYQYHTPLGMLRRGVVYNSICNGLIMQSPAAEGIMLATIDTMRSMYDSRLGSVLYGQRLCAVIHDELLPEFDYDADPEKATACAYAVAHIMKTQMHKIMPGMRLELEPCFMRRWSKDAETVKRDEIIIPWEDRHAVA